MKYHTLHRWDVSLAEAAQIQRELREQLILSPPPGFAPRLCAGADVSMTRFAAHAFAGFVTLELETLRVVETATAVAGISFPYIPGFLSFRELPALADAWTALQTRPDVLIVDGQGYAHPRRLGIACHAGLIFDVPTIGCAKSILIGRHAPLGEERGAVAPLLDGGEVVGMAVRTRTGISPVYVSIGHRVDLPTAVELVLRLTGKYRLPETTRRAHALVNEVRRAAEG